MARNAAGVYTRVSNSFSSPTTGNIISPTDAETFFDDVETAMNSLPIVDSAGLRAALSDETGTGVAVFATSPTITTPNITGNATLTNNTNGTAKYSVLNNSTGISAVAHFSATNGTNAIEFGQRGTAQTTYGILTANRSYCYGATDVAFVADGANFLFGGNAGLQTAKIYGTAADLGNFEIVGSFGSRAPVTLTGTSGTVTSVQGSVIVNASGAFTITLPAAASYSGHWIWIKSIAAQTIASATSNVVPRAGGAAGTALLASGAGNWCHLQSDGTNWITMAGN